MPEGVWRMCYRCAALNEASSQQMPHENLVGIYRTCSAPVRTVANLMDGEPWQCRSCSCILVRKIRHNGQTGNWSVISCSEATLKSPEVI